MNKNLRNVLLFFNLLLINILYSQNNINITNASSMALGGNTTTLSASQSILGNPATFAKEEYAKLYSMGAQNRFLLAELNLLHAGVMFKKKNNGFGVAIQYNGVPDFKQYGVGVTYGRRLFSKLDIATRLHFSQLDLNAYGKKSIVDADLGLYSTLNKEISFGFWAKNLIHSKVNSVENTETALHLGFCYAPSDKVKFCAESEKYLSQQVRFKAGIEYNAFKNLAFRAGFQSSPAMPSFGVGYFLKNLKLDLAAALHPNLGLTTALNLGFSL
jgi:hypothetical protein